MSELIRKTSRRIINFSGYSGVCHECNSPQTYSGVITAIVMRETEDSVEALPVDWFICCTCGENLRNMKLYKSLNVTKELSEL